MPDLGPLLLDERFHALDALLGQRTLLEILDIRHLERHHQALLAWLLDPLAEHGIGTRPLESFTRMVLRSGRTDAQWSAAELADADLGQATVTPEHPATAELDGRAWQGRLDILVEIPLVGRSESHPLLVVETKLDSDQGPEQTQRYASWASRYRRPDDAPEDDPRREPLLCYLAPVASTQPLAAGFQHISWTDTAAWITGLLPHAHVPRTRFILEDWRHALTQREDVEDAAQQAVVDALEQDHAALLTGLRRDASQLPPAILRRYRRAWTLLGVSHAARTTRSLGDSSFVLALRARLQDALPDRWWHKGSTGSLATESRSFREVVEHLRPHDAGSLRLKFWCDRPKRGRANMAVEFTGGPRGWDNAHAVRVRAALKEHLARVLADIPGSEPSGGSNIARRLSIPVPGVDEVADDTDDALDGLDAELDGAADFAVEVDRRLEAWIHDELPSVLQQAIDQHDPSKGKP